MPRDGSGASHNAVETGHNIVHGNEAGDNDVSYQSEYPDRMSTDVYLQSAAASGVDRSSKAAPPPDHEAGEGLEGLGGSGGGSSVTGSGKGPLESTVDKEAENSSK